MESEELRHLRGVVDEVAAWRKRAAALVKERRSVKAAAEEARQQLLARVVPLGVGWEVAWRTLQLSASDGGLATALARGTALPPLTVPLEHGIRKLTTDAERALRDVKALFGVRRMFAGKSRKQQAEEAAAYLEELRAWVLAARILGDLDRLEAWDKKSVPSVEGSGILDDSVGFEGCLGGEAELINRHKLDSANDAVRAIERAVAREAELRSVVTSAGNIVRRAEAHKLVAEMPVERLKDATSGQLRINALNDAGIRTVQQVLDHGSRILSLPGVGDTTGNRMIGAARTIWQTTLDEMPVRIDIKNRTRPASDLLEAMRAWDAARSIHSATTDLAAAEQLWPLLAALDHKTSHIVVIPEARSVADLHAFVAAVERRAMLLNGGGSAAAGDDVWDDLLARPADYYAMLAELGFLPDDAEKSQGDLPDEIVEAIRDLKLDTSHLKASLRGYQSFGARFAIVQRKVIIGDEMGLGKTVESLAVLTHLRAKGSHHFLVVCPAAVVTNWIREVRAKSDLRAHRLHGQGRDGALTSWIRSGGVAVTTYDSLGWLEGRIIHPATPACLVFDEAHYIKNPDALRTRRSTALIKTCERVMLLTGTPLENRIEEFRNLVGYLRPDLMISATEFAPRQFRKQVAPAYLTRIRE